MSTQQGRLGKYELQKRLGSGGMTEVWKAIDTGLQRNVAIKLLHVDVQTDPDFMKRFEREAGIVASLHHSNIVQVHDFQVSRPPESDGTIAYMVMDYVEGPTLANYISNTSRTGKFPSATEIVQLFTSIGAAIDYAHQKGIIHRNLTPGNILLDQRNTTRNPIGEPILVDFGIAKILGTSTGTLSGMWIDTPLYIAPEQAQGQPGTKQSDIYSLGVILYEICTGVLPFRGEKSTEIMLQQINSMPTPPNLINPNISPALAEVILRCLAKDPTARFPSASAIAVALAEAFNLPFTGSLGVTGKPLDMIPGSGPLTPIPPGQSAGRVSSVPSLTPPVLTAPVLQPTPSTGSGGQVVSVASLQTPQGSSAPSLPAPPPTPITPIPSFPPSPEPVSKKRRRGLLTVLILLFLLALAISGLGIFSLLTQQGSGVVPGQLVGHAFFVNSGQLTGDSSQGLNDELQIDLNNVPDPAAGKSYYAWLLGDLVLDADKNSSPTTRPAPILLGKVAVKNGGISIHYTNPQHLNLLAITSRFAITEESANSTPTPPTSPDHRTWRYYAEIPQVRPGTLAESELGALRHLLSDGPGLLPQGIHGGSAIQLLLHTQKVFEWASSARDFWNGSQTQNIDFIHRQVIRILDYVVSQKVLMTEVPDLPVLINTPNALIGPKNTQAPYVNRIRNTMQDVIAAPNVSKATLALARQISKDLAQVQIWLERVHQDAKQLVVLTNAQLAEAKTFTLLNDMQTYATYALAGQLNPASDMVQGGVVKVYDDIQRLAAFDIMRY